jgi:transposase
MFNAGMTMNAVAMNIGCSTRAIRHLRQRFQATGCTEDGSRSGRPYVTTRAQDP